MSPSFIFFKFLAGIWLCNLLVQALPIVEVKNGTLEGSLMTSRKGREFFAFRGIPFALPPVGSLRFKAPEPAAAWKGIRSVKKDAEQCIQPSSMVSPPTIGSEDCLYLNVYTPKLPNPSINNTQVGLPVMIWIHGGGFVGGTGNSEFYSPIYFLDYDVVLVSVNYRLGALGFLSTEDMACPGNNGMKDQVRSIEWVNENIGAFGGDPTNITLFGESAGAASVDFHKISPLSRGLFQRAISQSGTSLSSWSLTKPTIAKEHAERLAKYFNCSTSCSEEIVACLGEKDAADVTKTVSIFQVFGTDPIIPFRPVIEPNHSGAFITQEPAKYFEKGNVNDVPWIAGINSHEGAVRLLEIYGSTEEDQFKTLNDKWLELAPITLLYEDIYGKEYLRNISKRVREYYFDKRNIDNSSKFSLIDMYSDAWFNFDVQATVKYHREVFCSPVYYYYFSYKGEFSLPKLFGIKEDVGVCHGDDLFYLFPFEKGFPVTKMQKNEEDEKMIDLLTNLWFNFAKTGNPTPEITEMLPVKWEPVTTKELEYLEIKGSKNLTMLKNLNSERMAFWENLSSYREIKN